MKKISIIIPVYYNSESLNELIESIVRDATPNFEDYEIIMVDDGSGDDSWDIMKQIYQRYNNVRIAKLSRNFGAHAAVMAGFSMAEGDCVTSKAADMQEPTELLVDMYKKWCEGNKVVIATRIQRQEPLLKRLFADMYYEIIRKLALSNMPKKGFDICLLDRQVVDILLRLKEKNSAITLQVLWTGFKTSEVGYTRQARKTGRSRWTLAKKIKLTIDSLVSFSYIPIRIMTTLGGGFILGAVIWGVRILIALIQGNVGVRGWSSIILLLLVSSGVIMFTLGILGEYIWRTLDASRNRPLYIIDEMYSHETRNN